MELEDPEERLVPLEMQTQELCTPQTFQASHVIDHEAIDVYHDIIDLLKLEDFLSDLETWLNGA